MSRNRCAPMASRSSAECVWSSPVSRTWASSAFIATRAASARPIVRGRGNGSTTFPDAAFIRLLHGFVCDVVSLVAQPSPRKRLVLTGLVSYTYQRGTPSLEYADRFPCRGGAAELARRCRRAAPHPQRGES